MDSINDNVNEDFIFDLDDGDDGDADGDGDGFDAADKNNCFNATAIQHARARPPPKHARPAAHAPQIINEVRRSSNDAESAIMPVRKKMPVEKWLRCASSSLKQS